MCHFLVENKKILKFPVCRTVYLIPKILKILILPEQQSFFTTLLATIHQIRWCGVWLRSLLYKLISHFCWQCAQMQASVNTWHGGLCAWLPVWGVHPFCWKQHSHEATYWQHGGAAEGSLVWWLLGHWTYIYIYFFLISSLILLSCDKICIMKAFIQTSADESYSWPIDNLFLTGGGLVLELVLHSCVLLLDWAALLFHPWQFPSVIRIVLPVSGQVIVQGVLDQPLETLVSK